LCWWKGKLKLASPNVLRSISRFNSLSQWCASSILWQHSPENRLLAMTRFIIIAKQLVTLNNFNDMFAIVSALQSSSIYRLKCREKLKKKTRIILEELVEIMNSKASFKKYRETLASTVPPCIPYLGLFLTDLVFIDEGNEDYQEGRNIINFRKQELTMKVIIDIEKYQKWPYNFPDNANQLTDGAVDTLKELPHHNKEQLWELSLAIEPRIS